MSWDIAGMGAVASIGGDPVEIFSALCQGKTGLHKLRAFDVSRFRAQHAYEIDDRPEPGKDVPGRATRWLQLAIDQALGMAGLPGDLGDVPVLVGTTFREQRSAELWWREESPLDPAVLRFGPALRSAFGTAHVYTPASACAASLYGLGMATDLLALDLADRVVVAGTDAIPESAFGMMDRVQNQVPEALRPLDRARRGMLMGDGAAAVVLQRPSTHPGLMRARVRGVGMNCDGRHPAKPSRDGISRAIREAHERAAAEPADIDLIMLHGTGTPLNDETELAALAEVFGGVASRPYLAAIKSMTGHTSGGSGLLSLIMAVLAMENGLVPPVLGLTDPIEQAADFRVPAGQAAPARLATAQVNAFGLGGLNAVAVLDRVAA